MELKDTVKLMESDNYKERFQAEYFQLKTRIERLYNLLNRNTDENIDGSPRKLLERQYLIMNNYLYVLMCRADCEDINIMEVD